MSKLPHPSAAHPFQRPATHADGKRTQNRTGIWSLFRLHPTRLLLSGCWRALWGRICLNFLPRPCLADSWICLHSSLLQLPQHSVCMWDTLLTPELHFHLKPLGCWSCKELYVTERSTFIIHRSLTVVSFWLVGWRPSVSSLHPPPNPGCTDTFCLLPASVHRNAQGY